MKQLESTFANMTLVLFLVCAVSSAAVAYVYEITREPKAKTETAKKTGAVRRVLPEFDNDPVAEQYVLDSQKEWIFYPAKKSGKVVGTAVETATGKGYGGTIKLIIGFLPNGSIYDLEVIEHRETPGLGDKIERSKSNFSKQFQNKDPASFRLRVKKDGGDVDGITAATISSRAVCDALNRAREIFLKEGIK